MRAGRTVRTALALAALAWQPGCLVLGRASVGEPLPGPGAVAAVEAGRTTRAQVLQLLGPPDEFRQPELAAALPAAASQATRVLEERDVFHRASFTWVRSRRADRVWLLWPLFTHVDTATRVDRLTVLFDEQDVVTALGVERGIEAP